MRIMLPPKSNAGRRVPKRGFTLTELLVVTAVLMILLAMLLPALENARRSAENAICVNNLRVIGASIILYAGEYDDCYPVRCYHGSYPGGSHPPPADDLAVMQSFMKQIPADGEGGPPQKPPTYDGQGYRCWMWLLLPYHKNPRVYACPSAKQQDWGWTYGINPHFSFSVLLDNSWAAAWYPIPGDPFSPPIHRGFAFPFPKNKILAGDGPAGMTGGGRAIFNGVRANHATHENAARKPGDNCLFIDGRVDRLPWNHPAFVQPHASWWRWNMESDMYRDPAYDD